MAKKDADRRSEMLATTLRARRRVTEAELKRRTASASEWRVPTAADDERSDFMSNLSSEALRRYKKFLLELQELDRNGRAYRGDSGDKKPD